MNCDKINNLISAYIDNELNAQEMSLIQFHLKNCEECTLEYQNLLEAKNILGGLIKKPLPENYVFNLQNKIYKLSRQNKIKNFIKKIFLNPEISFNSFKNYKVQFLLTFSTLVLFVFALMFAWNTTKAKKSLPLDPHYYISEHNNNLLSHPLNENVFLNSEDASLQYVLYSED